MRSRPKWCIALLLSAVACWANALAQSTNVITLSTGVAVTCGSSGVLNVVFQQPAANNVASLQLDLRFFVSQFDSVFINDSNPNNDKPIVLKTTTLADHTVLAQPIVPDPDSNTSTADWRVVILDTTLPLNLIPNGTVATLQFFPASTATNGTHSIQVISVIGSDVSGFDITSLAGSNGTFLLSGCTTPNRVFLPLLRKP